MLRALKYRTFQKPKLKAWVFCFWMLISSLALGADSKSHLFDQVEWKRMLSKATDQTGLTILGMGTLITAITTSGDFSVRDQWENHQKISDQDASIGRFLGSGIPGTLIALTQYTFDSAAADIHARALIGAMLATNTLKFAVNRKRPGTSENHNSFPSGHTSTTFATATALSETYGWKAGAIAFPIAIFTGLTRISDDVHWFSDTVGGAVIGIAMGRAAALDEMRPSSFSWSPWIDGDQAGVIAQYRF